MSIEKRLQLIEDREAIRHLKHHFYCHCVDRAVAGEAGAMEQLIGRFTDDIVADFTGLPLAEGKAAVSSFYAQGVPAFLSYSQHRVTNDVIEIDGDTATGRWYIDCPVVFREGNPTGNTGPGFIGGRYEEEYRRENGVWKYSRIVALLDMQTEFSSNWNGVSQIFKNR